MLGWLSFLTKSASARGVTISSSSCTHNTDAVIFLIALLIENQAVSFPLKLNIKSSIDLRIDLLVMPSILNAPLMALVVSVAGAINTTLVFLLCGISSKARHRAIPPKE